MHGPGVPQELFWNRVLNSPESESGLGSGVFGRPHFVRVSTASPLYKNLSEIVLPHWLLHLGYLLLWGILVMGRYYLHHRGRSDHRDLRVVR